MLLLEPLAVGRRTLRNRIVMPAMHLGMTPDGEASNPLIAFYEARARGGAALIVVGACTIDDEAGGPFFLSLREDRFVPGLSRLTAAIRRHGALAGAQLLHAGRYAHSFLIGNRPAVAPSAVPTRYTRETPRELTCEEIEAVIRRYALAAGRAVAAGFDAVEIIASAGYLPCQFLSPVANRRTDEWGGSFENRSRFGVEVARAVRSAVGDDVVVGVRLAGNEFVEGGGGSAEAAAFGALLERAGGDYLSVTGGWHETKVPQILPSVPHGAFAYLAAGVRERVRIPVFAANRINHPRIAERILQAGLADAVCIGRGLVSDPDWPRKAAGEGGPIRRCVACAQGCFDRIMSLQPITCMVNPGVGAEGSPAAAPVRRKRVAVIGGGPAGLAAAVRAAERGHDVVLFERGRLGGQINLAAVSPGREELASVVEDLAAAARHAGVELHEHEPLDADAVLALRADAVIFATGARPIVPAIPGIDGPNVVHGWDVLAGGPVRGPRIVVLGGGAVGVDLARHLALRGALDAETIRFLLLEGAEEPETIRRRASRGPLDVTLVEMRQKVGVDLGPSTRWSLLQDLDRFGVRGVAGRPAAAIRPDAVELDGGETIPCDTVVLALGARPERSLYDAVASRLPEAHLVGDAREVRRALEAVADGYEAGTAV